MIIESSLSLSFEKCSVFSFTFNINTKWRLTNHKLDKKHVHSRVEWAIEDNAHDELLSATDDQLAEIVRFSMMGNLVHVLIHVDI